MKKIPKKKIAWGGGITTLLGSIATAIGVPVTNLVSGFEKKIDKLNDKIDKNDHRIDKNELQIVDIWKIINDMIEKYSKITDRIELMDVSMQELIDGINELRVNNSQSGDRFKAIDEVLAAFEKRLEASQTLLRQQLGIVRADAISDYRELLAEFEEKLNKLDKTYSPLIVKIAVMEAILTDRTKTE